MGLCGLNADYEDDDPFSALDRECDFAHGVEGELVHVPPCQLPPSPKTLELAGLTNSADIALEQEVLEELAGVGDGFVYALPQHVHEARDGDGMADPATPVICRKWR